MDEASARRLLRLAARGVVSRDELLQLWLERAARAARAGSGAGLGARPELVDDTTVWASCEEVARSLRAELDALWPDCGELLLDALKHERDRSQRWWWFEQRVRGLADLPPDDAGRAALALLREGVSGCPLEDRQIEDLARALERLDLTEALRRGLPDVPDLGAGHGIGAWRAAVGRAAAGESGTRTAPAPGLAEG